MKNVQTIFLGLAVAAIGFVSCEKDDNNISGTAIQRLQHNWQVDSISTRFHTATTDTKISYVGQPGDYYDFRTDNNLYIQLNGTKDTLSYSLLNDITLVVDNNGIKDTGSITSLTNNLLIGATRHIVNATDYNDVTAYLKR